MGPDLSRRKALQMAGSTVAVALAGCSSVLDRSTPEADSSLGTTAYEPVLGGQPTPEDGVPAVWGMVFAHPDSARKLIDWRALVSRESEIEPGSAFRSFDPDEQFVTIVIGVLPTGEGLTGYTQENDSALEDFVDDFRERPAFRDGQLHFEVTTYRAFSPDPDAPEYHYDYTFTRWNLNGHERPDGIVVNFHPT